MLVSVIIFVNILHNFATFSEMLKKINFLFIYLFIYLFCSFLLLPTNTAGRSSTPASGSREATGS
jgi:hypothetical protein